MLGLARAELADKQQLRQRYKELVLLVHPDKNTSTSRADAEAAFKLLSAAYEDLSHPPGRTGKRSSSNSDGDFGRKRRKGPGAASRQRSWCDLSYEEVAREIERLEEQVSPPLPLRRDYTSHISGSSNCDSFGVLTNKLRVTQEDAKPAAHKGSAPVGRASQASLDLGRLLLKEQVMRTFRTCSFS